MRAARKGAPKSLESEQPFPTEKDVQLPERSEDLKSITTKDKQQNKLARCRLLEMVPRASLRPHPALVDLNLMPSREQVFEKEKVGRLFFEQPLLITKDNVIVDGYKRYLAARWQKIASLPCLRCDLTEDQALEHILANRTIFVRRNRFCDILIALKFEAKFREEARRNQSHGGKNKLLPNLARVEPCDCRKEIAQLAGVAPYTVAKVKQILEHGIPQLHDALRSNQISIELAWKLSELSASRQDIELTSGFRRKREAQRIRRLIRKQRPQSERTAEALEALGSASNKVMACPELKYLSSQILDVLARISVDLPERRIA